MVLGRRGMACTSQPLATQAAIQVLREGGNAVDAAVCAAATLGVVEPFMTGLGGDCFMLVWKEDERRLYGLNGSGRAPAAATLEEMHRRGIAQMPALGALSITVPGAVDAWCAALERFGTLPLSRVLAPAIEYADAGFAVSEIIAHQWRLAAALLQEDEAKRVFLADGRSPELGAVIRFSDLAQSLRRLAAGGRDVLYRGELADRIVDAVARRGGLLSRDDLADHQSTWVEPLRTNYRGFDLCELPPNGQGMAALLALNILECFDLETAGARSAAATHLTIEAVKLAYADRSRWIADPAHAALPIDELLSKDYALGRAALVDPNKAAKSAGPGRFRGGGDTVYLTTADAQGNVVSLINSLFYPFGSGIVAEDTGIALQNRGYGFTLDPAHPNCIAPRKRPFHTIIPAMLFSGGRPVVSFGVMGGDMQAQGHVQVVSNIADAGMNAQQAIAAPRFHFLDADRVAVETEIERSIGADLRARGHQILNADAALGRGGFGGAQAIAIDANGTFWGASDPRKDGCAAGW